MQDSATHGTRQLKINTKISRRRRRLLGGDAADVASAHHANDLAMDVEALYCAELGCQLARLRRRTIRDIERPVLVNLERLQGSDSLRIRIKEGARKQNGAGIWTLGETSRPEIEKLWSRTRLCACKVRK